MANVVVTPPTADRVSDRALVRRTAWGRFHTLPVVEASGEIVWVAGVAVDERFAAAEDEPGAVALTARSAATVV